MLRRARPGVVRPDGQERAHSGPSCGRIFTGTGKRAIRAGSIPSASRRSVSSPTAPTHAASVSAARRIPTPSSVRRVRFGLRRGHVLRDGRHDLQAALARRSVVHVALGVRVRIVVRADAELRPRVQAPSDGRGALSRQCLCRARRALRFVGRLHCRLACRAIPAPRRPIARCSTDATRRRCSAFPCPRAANPARSRAATIRGATTARATRRSRTMRRASATPSAFRTTACSEDAWTSRSASRSARHAGT